MIALLVGVLAAVPLLASPAHAAAADLNLTGAFDASIEVGLNAAATGTVSDTINPTVSYVTALTATGGGTCLLATGEVAVTGVNTATGNPSVTHTLGSCNLYNASVEYTLTWTSILGTTGQFQRSCEWVIGIQVCSPDKVHGQLPLGTD